MIHLLKINLFLYCYKYAETFHKVVILCHCFNIYKRSVIVIIIRFLTFHINYAIIWIRFHCFERMLIESDLVKLVSLSGIHICVAFFKSDAIIFNWAVLSSPNLTPTQIIKKKHDLPIY